MNRDELVTRFGEEIVNKLDNERCDFTNRVMNDETVEFKASVKTETEDGLPVTLSAYYYQNAADVNAVEELDALTWKIDHYSIF